MLFPESYPRPIGLKAGWISPLKGTFAFSTGIDPHVAQPRTIPTVLTKRCA